MGILFFKNYGTQFLGEMLATSRNGLGDDLGELYMIFLNGCMHLIIIVYEHVFKVLSIFLICRL